MQSKATTVTQYLSELPADRKAAMTKLRKVIKSNLPKGFKEEMSYGMIGFVVPHSLYPAGYHTTPHLPLPFLNIASQKNFVAVYHMCITSKPDIFKWFKAEYEKTGIGKLDMGKACIRLKKIDQIPFELFGELAKKITVEEWVKIYDHYKSKR